MQTSRQSVPQTTTLRVTASENEPDLDAVTAADVTFHDIVFDCCGNPTRGGDRAIRRWASSPRIREGHQVSSAMVPVLNHEVVIDAIAEDDGGEA